MVRCIILLWAAFSLLPLPLWGYEPAGDRIRTRWAAGVGPETVSGAYPRPQLIRSEWQSLNGLWRYKVTGKDDPMPERIDEGDILVPFAIESSLSGVGKKVSAEEALWYQTLFTVPSAWKLQRVLLHFEAVDWSATIFVDGREVGSHTGGYVPFTIDITPCVKAGKVHTLTVRVTDPTDKEYVPSGKQITNPGVIWYTSVTGIWQTVWLEPVPVTRITSYDAETLPDRHGWTVTVDSDGLREGDEIWVDLLEGSAGLDVESVAMSVPCVVKSARIMEGKAVLEVPDAVCWSPDNPYLYGLRIRIVRGKKTVDTIYGYTSIRTISVGTDSRGYRCMSLNGKPLFQFGPLDQGYWPDGLYTAPCDEALQYDLVKTRDWGFNMVRKHIKVEPSRWYYYCDRLGLLVWQDMPSISPTPTGVWDYEFFDQGKDQEFTEWEKANFRKEWKEIIDHLRPFHCIVVWVPFNEGWGQFETKANALYTKRLDPTRLVNPISGGNYFTDMEGDIFDIHNYPHPMMRLWDSRFVNVLGEYGGISWPVDGHIWKPGEKTYGYLDIHNGKELTDAYEIYVRQLLELVERGCAAAVYTETTDVENETNGLMTYDRAVVKPEERRLKALNRQVIDHFK